MARFRSLCWFPYVAPMAVFTLLTLLESAAPHTFYVWLYAGKVVIVTALLLALRAPWREIRFDLRVVPVAILVGVFVLVEWIALDQWIPYPHLGTRVGFDPFTAIASPAARGAFLAARFFGLVVMVPVMEEIFWRSFLLRYVTDADFKKLPLDGFSGTAFVVVAGAFGLAHTEWLVAIVAACAYALLLRSTRSLFACIVAHGVTNLLLGVYILRTGQWIYW